jgi:hypothetical protein
MDTMLHTEVRWLSRRKLTFGFQHLSETMKFLQDRCNLKDSRWLLYLAFPKDLTAKLNEINSGLQGEKKTLLK